MDFRWAYGSPERSLGSDNISHRPHVKGCGDWSSGCGGRQGDVNGVFGHTADLDRDRTRLKIEAHAFSCPGAARDAAEPLWLEIGVVLDDVDPGVIRDRHGVETGRA